ncbi:MAG: terpene cyclase/mutase family protein [Planctomycetia bacterium]|nr:terpene cyclase/mutase family protein [Planctomycetia bacterium]
MPTPLPRRKFLAQALVGSLSALALPRLLRGQDPAAPAHAAAAPGGGDKAREADATRDPEKTAVELMNPETLRAIDAGLKFLAARQQDDGSFGGAGYSRSAAVVAVGGLAFMAGGSTPGRGPYGREVNRAIKFILDNTEESGFINVPGATSHGPMYGHGFATLFLAEAYGMAQSREVRPKLAKAVKLIVNTQNREGGWRYMPQPADADISVTVCQIMALRAARNAGFFVPNDTIDRCVEYVKRCQNADGGFRYMLPGGPSAFPRSAAGVVALQSAGDYDSAEVKRGIKYLYDFVPRLGRTHESHYFYGHYYATQAMWHAGGQYWAAWYPAVRDEMLAMFRPPGFWMDSICQEYGTAMACLALQVPNNSLPIFQR